MHALDRLHHLHRAVWATLVAAVVAIVCTLVLASSLAGAGSQTGPAAAIGSSWTAPAPPLVSPGPPWAEHPSVLSWRLGTPLPTQR